ncbi:MFS general substrate transporter [Aspergillus welwitschiae]|uniref:MFS general substrate transporter n=1 Tax=Aspergillus welwitschiae TaxID=1341132 RepID=A0A3F3Q0K9_9EURO|nr:MFS general substrate transporter [Aspergillus welwitschiae]RDH32166.1 MFS general substrate transporter [Aspergillus welwitschiae]
MQAYFQYRAIRNSVRKQLHDFPQWIHDSIGQAGSGSSLQRRPSRPPPIPGISLIDNPNSREELSHILFVDWESSKDPLSPRQLSLATRVAATLIVTSLAFVVSASSSIESAVVPQSTADYGVSEVVAALFVGIFLLGFATGSLISGPLSEILGRNAVYLVSTSLFMIFVMGSWLSPNTGAKLAFRFLAGVCGCPPLTCAGGTVADIWDSKEKTLAFPVYAILSYGGAILAPVIASYMGSGSISYRWTDWIVLIMAGLVLSLIVLVQPETYGPLLLRWKSKHLRQLTGDPRYLSKLDLDQTPLLSRIRRACVRQFTLPIREPIVLVLSLYLTVLYIVLFAFFVGYADIFTDVHGMSQGLTNVVWVAIHRKRGLKGDREVSEMGNETNVSEKPSTIQPEDRLWYAMMGAPAMTLSLFWMGWTDYPSISVWSPIVGSAFFGFGSICIFISSYMYIIDTYEVYAASALGFMTSSRYCVAGGMTVVGVPFYHNMGVHWTLTILGIISAILTPVPYILWKFGPVVRGWSRLFKRERRNRESNEKDRLSSRMINEARS